MPLSDHEQRMLDQIESALYAEDPKFASSVRGGNLRAPSARRRLQGVALFVVGLAMLVSGVAINATWIGGLPILSVIGFIVMFGGVVFAITGSRRPVRSTSRRHRRVRRDPSAVRAPAGRSPAAWKTASVVVSTNSARIAPGSVTGPTLYPAGASSVSSCPVLLCLRGPRNRGVSVLPGRPPPQPPHRSPPLPPDGESAPLAAVSEAVGRCVVPSRGVGQVTAGGPAVGPGANLVAANGAKWGIVG